MQTLRGKGKLYNSGDAYSGEITYNIRLKPATGDSGEQWQGEITPGDGIMPVGDYIIEPEDGRRGPCVSEILSYSSFGLVVDSFGVEGTGPLS